MAPFDDFVLVTGISGFAGAHVVHRLVQEGFRVRGTARTSKVSESQAACDAAYGKGKAEVVAIDDVAAGDFTEALKDITAIIHVASPSGRFEPPELLSGAIEGTTRVFRQGQKAGIKKFSFISSISATVDWGTSEIPTVLTEKSWNSATREQALEPGRHFYFVYFAAKTLAEREVWKFAEEYPDISVTCINPPFFLGPNAPCQSIKPGEATALSSNLLIYNLLLQDSKQQTPTYGFVDVKDVAAALVAGIRTPGRNRILLAGEWFEIKDAVEHIASVRPELKNRLMNPGGPTHPKIMIDNTRAYEILGIEPVSSWKDNVIETIDFLVKLEKEWVESGVDIRSTLQASDWRA